MVRNGHAVAVLGGLALEHLGDAVEPLGVDVVEDDLVERATPEQRAVDERDAEAAAPDDRELHAGRISAIPAAESSALGRKPHAGVRGEAGTVVAGLAARGEHHRRHEPVAGEPLGDLEAVDVGELHVEQDDLGAQLVHRVEGRHPVRRLAHDHVTLELEQPARGGPEPRVVVDDEDGCSHRESFVPHTHFPQVVTM